MVHARPPLLLVTFPFAVLLPDPITSRYWPFRATSGSVGSEVHPCSTAVTMAMTTALTGTARRERSMRPSGGVIDLPDCAGRPQATAASKVTSLHAPRSSEWLFEEHDLER